MDTEYAIFVKHQRVENEFGMGDKFVGDTKSVIFWVFVQKQNVSIVCCHNAKELHCVGLHWHVPFIEDLLDTVQVVW